MQESMKVGQVFATDGAWQRKYQLVEISPVMHETQVPKSEWTYAYVVAEVKVLGLFYATGRQKIAKKGAPNREIYMYIYQDKDGSYHVPTCPGGMRRDFNFDINRVGQGDRP